MSRRGLEGGRKKSLLDPRRHVKCPVSECKYSGRTVLNFFSQSSMNNNERPDSAETGAGAEIEDAEIEDAEMENAEMEFAAGMENTAGMEDVHMEDAVQMEGEGRDRIQHLLTNVAPMPPPSPQPTPQPSPQPSPS